jgi:hypothetical protein
MRVLDALKENMTLVGFTSMWNSYTDHDAFQRAAIETEAPLKVFQNEELSHEMKRARVALALVRGMVKARRRPSDRPDSPPLKYMTTDVARLVVDSLF